MEVKFCTKCRYSKTEYVNQMVQTPKGPVPRSGSVMVCTKHEFLHPVMEEPMPCMTVREDSRFCGFEGKGFEQQSEIKLVVDNTKKDEPLIVTDRID